MIKTILAYGELIFGLPLLVATMIWFIPSLVIAKTIGKISDRLSDIIDAGMEGVLSSIFACVVFYWLGVKITWAIPIILVIVTSLWESARKESFRAWPAAVGIIIGFFLYPLLFGIMG